MSPMPSGNPRRNFSLRLFVAEMFSLCCCCSFSLLFATFGSFSASRLLTVTGHKQKDPKLSALLGTPTAATTGCAAV